MKLDEIKSPLPSRVPLGEEGKTEEPEKAVSEPVKEEPKKNLDWIKWAGLGVGVIAIILIGVKLLTGKGEMGGGSGELVYWGLWEEVGVMEGVIADFEAKNPKIKVKYIKNSEDNYRSRLAGRLTKSGQEMEVPDIFRIHSSWLPMFAKNLEPVPKETSQSIGLETDFYEVYKRDLKKDGVFLAVPLMYDGLSMFYNKEMLRGAKIEVPKTWWGLVDGAKKMVKRDETGRMVKAGVGMGSAENVDHWSDMVGVMLAQIGADVRKTDSENRKLIENALTFYISGGVGWDESLPRSTDYFASGNLGFYFGPVWRVFNFSEMNPGLDYGIAKVPQLPTLENIPLDEAEASAGAGNITDIHWASYWVEGVNSQSDNKEAAFKFLEYLASKEGLERMYTAASQIRNFGEIYPRKSMKALVSENGKIKPFVEAADSASSGWLSSRTFDDGVNDEMAAYFRDAINKVNHERRSVEEAREGLLNGINQVVNKYQLLNY